MTMINPLAAGKPAEVGQQAEQWRVPGVADHHREVFHRNIAPGGQPRPENRQHRQADEQEVQRQAPARETQRARAAVRVEGGVEHVRHGDGGGEEQQREHMQRGCGTPGIAGAGQFGPRAQPLLHGLETAETRPHRERADREQRGELDQRLEGDGHYQAVVVVFSGLAGGAEHQREQGDHQQNTTATPSGGAWGTISARLPQRRESAARSAAPPRPG